MSATAIRGRRRFEGSLGVVGALNVLALIGLWNLHSLGPALVGMGLLAYFFGLRHALDIDHITAIDTVARTLRDQNRKSSSVGLYFSLGHSSVVILLSLFVATIARSHSETMTWLSRTGSVVGTVISAAFLLVMGLANSSIFLRLARKARGGQRATPSPAPEAMAGGLFMRMFSLVFRLVRRQWHMYGVGFLFGLGFDTASEIAVLSVSASMAHNGVASLRQIMIFPLLFTAGMSLLDTLDGIAVARMYDWAVRYPSQRGRLNMAFTGVGVLVALVVSISEWAQLWVAHSGAALWKGLDGVGFSAAGGLFTALLMGIWLMGWLWYRRDGTDAERDFVETGPLSAARQGEPGGDV